MSRVSTPALLSRRDIVQGMVMQARVSDGSSAPGPPVVLVHGLSMSSRYMLPTAGQLATTFCVYTPDLPGFGQSEKPSRTLSIAELADILATWMDVVGLERAAMLGNSFGCQVIVALSVQHPERVTHNILVGPAADPRGRTVHQHIARAAYDVFYEPASLLFVALRDYLLAGPVRTIRTLQHLLQDPIETKLPQVAVPTLVVRGAYDMIVPQRWAEEVTQLLPQGRLVVIPQAAHAVNYSHPIALAQVAHSFLEGSQ